MDTVEIGQKVTFGGCRTATVIAYSTDVIGIQTTAVLVESDLYRNRMWFGIETLQDAAD